MRRAIPLFSASWCITAATVAQLPTSVDIDLADNPSADSLEVRVRANGADFDELVTALTFTIQWPVTSPATLGGRTVPCDVGLPITTTTTVDDGAWHYKTYNAFGLSLIQDECPEQAWLDGQWRTIMRVQVNGLDGCTAFNIVNDAWTSANNRDYYLSLNGADRTGTIDPEPDSLGACAPDCLGVIGGADLPGTACDDADACTANDLWDTGCTCAGVFQDQDSDGVCDASDGCPSDPNKTSPGVCGCGIADIDTDGDAAADCIDGCPMDPAKTDPGTCGCGIADTDTDGDLFADCQDACPLDPLKVSPGLCGCGVTEADSDGDAVPDCIDGCPNDPLKTAPGACGCAVPDTDSDGDATADCIDACPADPLKVLPGVCGCGVADTDGDADGTADCVDGCPADPLKTSPGLCGCGVADADGDGDGTPDCNDGCPADAQKVAPGECGCGNPEPGSGCDDGDLQTTNDQIQTDCSCLGALVDCNDNDTCTVDSFDGVACVNAPLPDTDGDGSCDLIDGCPLDPAKLEPGVCGCGIADNDADLDGTPDCNDGCPGDPLKLSPGICGCGVADSDTDADGAADCVDACPTDPEKVAPGVCGCGVADTDTDVDGTADCLDSCPLVTGQVGSACDDGDLTTTNDALNDQCACIGLPGNDPCFTATPVQVWPAVDCPANATVGDNTNATPDAGNTLCNLDGFLNDVWFVFNSGDNSEVVIDLDPGTMAAWGLAIYAECNATGDLYCASGVSEPFTFNTQPNTPYLVRIYWSAWFGQGGTYALCVSEGLNTGVPSTMNEAWEVFPNPTDGTFTVSGPFANGPWACVLRDMSGRTVLASQGRGAPGRGITVRAEGLPPGVYLLEVRTSSATHQQRVGIH